MCELPKAKEEPKTQVVMPDIKRYWAERHCGNGRAEKAHSDKYWVVWKCYDSEFAPNEVDSFCKNWKEVVAKYGKIGRSEPHYIRCMCM